MLAYPLTLEGTRGTAVLNSPTFDFTRVATMPWQQLTLQTERDRAQQIDDLLTELGACAVTIQDAGDNPIYEPAPGETPLWQDCQVTGLFTADIHIDAITQTLRPELSEAEKQSLSLSTLADQDWQRAWQDDFHPQQFGDNLWICPSWQNPPCPEAINILLDPGLAFGSGSHPTTALCLEWLAQHNLQNKLVIDYGCGSGILAIAAAKLGARQVYAIDHDPQALLATHNNAANNDLSGTHITTLTPDQIPALQADILIANIVANPLCELAPRFAELLNPGGNIVLSGILPDQNEQISHTFAGQFVLDKPIQKDTWLRVTGQKHC